MSSLPITVKVMFGGAYDTATVAGPAMAWVNVPVTLFAVASVQEAPIFGVSSKRICRVPPSARVLVWIEEHVLPLDVWIVIVEPLLRFALSLTVSVPYIWLDSPGAMVPDEPTVTLTKEPVPTSTPPATVAS